MKARLKCIPCFHEWVVSSIVAEGGQFLAFNCPQCGSDDYVMMIDQDECDDD